MKNTKFVLVLSVCLLFFNGVRAQFSLPVADGVATFEGEDSIRKAVLSQDYFSLSRYRTERKAIRKQRNSLEIGGRIQGTATQYNDYWKAGGDNTITVLGSLWCYHTFKKNRFTLTSKLDLSYGQNFIKEEDIQWFKNQDKFTISTSASWDVGTTKWRKNWSYNVAAELRSQFDKGYKSRAEQKKNNLLSDLFSPGYFNLSVGMKYTSPDKRFPFVVSLSPVSTDITFVKNEKLRATYGMKAKKWNYGDDGTKTVAEYYSAKFAGGSSVGISFDRYFDKKKIVRYRTTVLAFYGWMTNLSEKNMDPENYAKNELFPTVNWENTLDVQVVKYLATTFSYQLYYNKAQIDKLQMKYYLSIGLSYKFNNK